MSSSLFQVAKHGMVWRIGKTYVSCWTMRLRLTSSASSSPSSSSPSRCLGVDGRASCSFYTRISSISLTTVLWMLSQQTTQRTDSSSMMIIIKASVIVLQRKFSDCIKMLHNKFYIRIGIIHPNRTIHRHQPTNWRILSYDIVFVTTKCDSRTAASETFQQ